MYSYKNIDITKIELKETRKDSGIACKCFSVMHHIKVDYPINVNDGKENHIRYYSAYVIWCEKCKMGYMPKDEFIELIKKYLKKRTNCEEKIIIHFSNLDVVPDPKYKGLHYFKYPKENTNYFYLESVVDTGELRDSSLLSLMGYSVQRVDDERRIILGDAVERLGKPRIITFLNQLISLRKKQKNGVQKYSNAIRIWESDIAYINSL